MSGVAGLAWVGDLAFLSKLRPVSAAEAKRGRASDWLFVALIVVGLLALLFGSIALTLFVFWYIATHLRFGL